jgi:hypothetical protein
MNIQKFQTAFEQMRQNNLGKHFDRRELGLLATHYGTYITTTMWASGLGCFFNRTRIGRKYLYSFRNTPVTEVELNLFVYNLSEYTNNSTQRTIEHAKRILRQHGITTID